MIDPDAPTTRAATLAASDLRDSLPGWAREIIDLYESGASSQFILHGNVEDRLVFPADGGWAMGNLRDFLVRVLLARFDILLSYDIGNGLRIEKGESLFAQWPAFRENPKLPKAPRAAVESLTHYFRYCANLSAINNRKAHVACVIRTADLVAPAFPGGLAYDLNALALLMRDWSTESSIATEPIATFLIAENLNDLHPLLVNNSRAAHINIPLPAPADLERALALLAATCPDALGGFAGNPSTPAHQLAGASLSAVEELVRIRQHRREALQPDDLVALKKRMVENDCNGLIEFIESDKTLDALYGQDRIKERLRQDIVLWRQNDLDAMPMGYLFCGPVGTGKTFMVKCLAGEAGTPVVKIKNFRDKWVGSSEGNLEKIFRLLHALGRCFVFIDEADQALGRRDSGAEDSGVSGRLYSMMAEEMSNTANRGRIIWILASSRPDLIEVDLKRPGRVDLKIPLFPTTTPEEGFQLIRALCASRRVTVPESAWADLKDRIPMLLTPGAAEVLAVKVYRLIRTQNLEPIQALRDCLTGYRNPVPADVMQFQIDLAVREATDLDFVPEAIRQLVDLA